MVGSVKLKLGIQLFAFVVNGGHVLSFITSVRTGSPSCVVAALRAVDGVSDTLVAPTLEKPCFWKTRASGSKWQERIHIRDLAVGQKLSGYVVEDLLEGSTGPKVFFECGVGRTTRNGNWDIVNGMLRLERSKLPVAKKRAARLRKKAEVELFVSRIYLDCGRFEVVRTPEEAEKYKNSSPKRSISSFLVGDEVIGRIVELLPYGAMVDIGANRLGLLHIQRVADLYQKYIDKEKGLVRAGLERGARVRLTVASNSKRRLSLDFTEEVKKDAERTHQSSISTAIDSISQNDIEAKQNGDWPTHFAEEKPLSSEDTGEGDSEDSSLEEDEGDYDEDTDIEDAFGLGFY
eukprot:scaffold681_cov130-Cylindrotheca_fusiformis.AAC.5